MNARAEFRRAAVSFKRLVQIIRNKNCFPPLIPGSDYMCWTDIICRFWWIPLFWPEAQCRLIVLHTLWCLRWQGNNRITLQAEPADPQQSFQKSANSADNLNWINSQYTDLWPLTARAAAADPRAAAPPWRQQPIKTSPALTGPTKPDSPHPRDELADSRMQGRKVASRAHHDAVLRELFSPGTLCGGHFIWPSTFQPVQFFPSCSRAAAHRCDARRDVQHRQHPVRPAELQGAAAAAPERPGGAVRRPHGLYLHRLQRTVLGYLRTFSPRDSVRERDPDWI